MNAFINITNIEDSLALASEYEAHDSAMMEAMEHEYAQGCAEFWHGNGFNPEWPAAKKQGYRDEQAMHDPAYQVD